MSGSYLCSNAAKCPAASEKTPCTHSRPHKPLADDPTVPFRKCTDCQPCWRAPDKVAVRCYPVRSN